MPGTEDVRLDEIISSLARRVRQQTLFSPLGGEIGHKLRNSEPAGRKFPLATCLFIGVFFAAILPFFVYSPFPLLNVAKLSLLLFSLVGGAMFIVNPSLMAALDDRLVRNILPRRLAGAASRCDLAFFRLQGLYFIVIAFFIARL